MQENKDKKKQRLFRLVDQHYNKLIEIAQRECGTSVAVDGLRWLIVQDIKKDK